MGGDPRSGALFVFLSRRADRLKLLWWDHNGFAVLYKRLHRAMTQAPKLQRLGERLLEALLVVVLTPLSVPGGPTAEVSCIAFRGRPVPVSVLGSPAKFPPENA